jgi:4'-phosphopantetheinyl transferase
MTARGRAATVTVPHEVADEVWVLCHPGRTDDSRENHREDLARADRLPAWRAAEFLAGRAVLRRLLSEVCPELASASVRPDASGRPRLVGRPDVGISVSHDGGVTAAAVAPGRDIGVDVQVPPRDPPDRLLRRCLGAHAPRIAELPAPERARELAWVWAVQESCVKAAGTGLAGRPWSIGVPPGRLSGRWGTYQWVSLRDRSRIPLGCAFSHRAGPPPRSGAPRSPSSWRARCA